MSLRSKIVVILFAVVLVYAAVDRVIQEVVIAKSFVALEEDEAGRDLKRVVQAIESEVRHLSIRCDDWATWDDTYRFVEDAHLAMEAESAKERIRYEDRATGYIVSNLVPESFHKNNLSLLYICDTKGKVVWGRSLALVDDRDFVLRDFPTDQLPLDHPLLAPGTKVPGTKEPGEKEPGTKVESLETEHASGLLMTERGPMLVSAKPIQDSHRQGPARGTVIMGRMLTVGLVAALKKQTGVDFRIWRVAEEELPDEEREISNQIGVQGGPDARVIRASDDETLHAYTTFHDIADAPALLIRANIAREITARGTTAAHYALISTIVAGLLLLLVLLWVLQRTVLNPIAALTEQAVAIGKSENFGMKLDLRRSDEIGILSREFDAMMEKLADSRAALVKAAHAAGMSEMATGVLHNVGNVLNSVNVSATLVADKARSSGLSDMKLALQAVEESSGDFLTFLAEDPRGEHLYPLLTSLAAEVEREHELIAREAKSLSEGIDHIKTLIQSQQSHAGRSGVLVVVSLADEIEAALALTGKTVDGKAIEVVREYDAVPSRAVDRHRLKEILVNLIQNARQAMQKEAWEAQAETLRTAASVRGGRVLEGLDSAQSTDARQFPDPTGAPGIAASYVARLTLRLRAASDGRVRIEIEDSGVGIPGENLSRIFTHGFTTKRSGHGFGLHASANAATEMGGALTVKSDGPGSGATFILDLPIETAHAAGARE